jgi:hypothetical protein
MGSLDLVLLFQSRGSKRDTSRKFDVPEPVARRLEHDLSGGPHVGYVAA